MVSGTNALHQQGGYNNFNQNQFNRQPFQGARQQNFQQNFNQQPQFQVTTTINKLSIKLSSVLLSNTSLLLTIL